MRARPIFVLLFMGLGSNVALGQTAGTLGFQGLLKDAKGDPVSGPVDLEFRIYDAETLGNVVDMDGDGVVEDPGDDVTSVLGLSVTDGIVSTKFGPVHPTAFDGTQRWLEVRVDGTPLSRLEMVTAPATSEQVNIPGTGTAAITVDEATGNVGLGTTNPERVLHTVGDIVLIERAGNAPGIILKNTGNGSIKASWALYTTGPDTGRVEFTDATLAETVIYLTDGKMGVGDAAATPANTLTVAGDADFTGNVGIGTTTPATALDVNGTATATAFVGDGSGLTGISVDDADADPANELQDLAGVLGQGNDAGGADMLNLGNVGIGTTTPAQKLSLFDGELVLKVASNLNDQSILFQNAGNAYTWRLYRSDADGVNADFHIAGGPAFVDFTALPDRLTIDTAGNVGIGTTTPATELDVAGTVTATFFVGDGSGLANLPGASPWTLSGGDISYTAGNVGIGTTEPAEGLHVSGGNILADRRTAVSGLARSLVLGGARSGGGGVAFATIQFQNFDSDNGGSDYVGAEILSTNAGSVDAGDLRFFVNDGSGGGRSEAMRIDRNGNVDMMSNKITNVASPTAIDHVATKGYVDTAGAGCNGVVLKKTSTPQSTVPTLTVNCPAGMTIIACGKGVIESGAVNERPR